MTCKVSIIINNYNYEAFVGDAIESALAQTYSTCEVVVVDDGSSDGSRTVIDGFGARVTSIFKENGGQASAFNAGFRLATGDIIMFLDSDDMLHTDAAVRVVDAFRGAPCASKVQYRLQVVDARGRDTGRVVPSAHVRLPTGDLRPYLCKPCFTWWAPTSGQAFRAATLRRIFPLPENEHRHGVDYFLQPVVAMMGHVVSIDEVHASYRIHGSNDSLRDGLDLDVLRSHLARARDIHPHLYRMAAATGLDGYPSDVADLLDVALLTERMTSLRLGPEQHPIDGDRRAKVAHLGLRAALGRPDVAAWARVLQAAWFLAMLVVPRPMANWAATRLLYPATRGRLETDFEARSSRRPPTSRRT